METHFIRQTKKYHERLASPIESVVYASTPNTRLVVLSDLLERVGLYYRAHPEEGSPAQLAILGAVRSLVERGFLVEIIGLRLEKLLESL